MDRKRCVYSKMWVGNGWHRHLGDESISRLRALIVTEGVKCMIQRLLDL